jgi:capsular exopolysaccharide synthesis family protein
MELSFRGNQVAEYWRVLLHRRWAVYLAVVTVCLTVLITSFLTTPLYRATVVLQIERQTPNILTFRDLSRIDNSWIAYSDFYQTQYQIMASTPVARLAVEQLGLDSHPAFNPEEIEPGLWQRFRGLFPKKGTTATPDAKEMASAAILGSLEVSPISNSHLVHLSIVDPDPQLAADIANAMAGAYTAHSIQTQSTTAATAQEFLVDQIVNLKQSIAEHEHELREYGRQTGILTIEDAENLQLQALREVALREATVATGRAEAEARYRTVQGMAPDALPEVLQSELVGRMREEYARYEAEYTQNSRRFKDDWPGMQTLKSKLEQAQRRLQMEIDQLAKQVRATAESAYHQALEEERNLAVLWAEKEAEAQQLKTDAIEYATLQGDVDKMRETLSRLIRRQNEMDVSEELLDLDPESNSTNIRVMEAAKPPLAPFKPRTKLNLVLGCVLGLLLGVGMALFLDYLDNTVKSALDLEHVVDYPLLTSVPLHGAAIGRLQRVRRRPLIVDPEDNFDLIAHIDPSCPATEAYRELRTALQLSSPGEPPRQIVVTSALPGEGKSATTLNLAIVLSQLGKRVLIIDTDLRRPRLHLALGVPSCQGASTYLSGMEQLASRLVLRTDIPNLDLLPSGPVPPNPSELLNSPRFRQMGDELLSQGYSHLIYDSPPVLSVSDSLILANAVDTAILVVRASETPRQSLKIGADRLASASTGPIGLVLNGVELGSRDYAYRSYYSNSRGETLPAEAGAIRSGAGIG